MVLVYKINTLISLPIYLITIIIRMLYVLNILLIASIPISDKIYGFYIKQDRMI